jgi:hypothetical protein
MTCFEPTYVVSNVEALKIGWNAPCDVVMITVSSSCTEVRICTPHGSRISNACSILLLADTSNWSSHIGQRQTHQTLHEIKPIMLLWQFNNPLSFAGIS